MNHHCRNYHRHHPPVVATRIPRIMHILPPLHHTREVNARLRQLDNLSTDWPESTSQWRTPEFVNAFVADICSCICFCIFICICICVSTCSGIPRAPANRAVHSGAKSTVGSLSRLYHCSCSCSSGTVAVALSRLRDTINGQSRSLPRPLPWIRLNITIIFILNSITMWVANNAIGIRNAGALSESWKWPQVREKAGLQINSYKDVEICK